MKQTAPYIHFDGKKCREAMEFYHSCLGGKLAVMTVGECPPEIKEGMKKSMPGVKLDDAKVMHASIEGEDGRTLLLAADMMDPKTFKPGDTMTASILTDDERWARGAFQKLSEGGKTTMEPEVMFWGGLFASWTDKFGVDWMMNCEMPKKA